MGEDKNLMVIYITGEFCVHPQSKISNLAPYQLRISYGFEEIGRIKQALEYMKQAVDFQMSNLKLIT